MESETELLFERARQVCLSFEDAFEKQSHGSPAFFIQKGGQFAALWHNHHNDGNTALLIAQPPGLQEALIATNGELFYRPPYYGPSGWIGVRLDLADDWELIEDLIAQGHAFVSTKRKRPRKSV